MTLVPNLLIYGELTEPTTLKIQRLLPGPIERVWAYLTDEELRRKWLAAGKMDPKSDEPFELVWHNSELTNPPGQRPEGFGEEHRMQCQILAFDPPRKLAFSFGRSGDVTIELEPKGHDVQLTLLHRRIPDRNTMLMVSAGWHAHLDILVARSTAAEPEPFWDHWSRLKRDYEERLPA
jgi:uncharacterized protein YndB with AHSA1/START domain